VRLADRHRGITPAIRHEILTGGALCDYCGFTATEVDHIVPRSRGGGLDRENLCAACLECNREKSDMTVGEWIAWRQERGWPWPIPHFLERISDFINRHGIENLKDDFIDDWPGGYEAVRAEVVAGRNKTTRHRGSGAPVSESESE
jgi:hypothetical protein